MQNPTTQRDGRRDSLQTKGPTPLRERGEILSSRQENDEGPKIQRNEQGRIPQWYFQIEEEIFLCNPLKVEESTSFQEAVDSPNHIEWVDAMKDEMDSMARNKIWELVNLALRCKSIETSGFFKLKYHADGSIDKFKTRLGEKGFTKIEGIG